MVGPAKTQAASVTGLAAMLGLAIWSTGPWVVAQTPLGLHLRLEGGKPQLIVSGEAGNACQIQWTDKLSATNRWFHFGHCTLSNSPSLLSDLTSSSTNSRYYRAVGTPHTNLVWISPGTFTMGSPPDEADRGETEGPQTVVTISRGFWMGKFEVTQGEYEAVMGSNPSYFQPPNATADTNRPAESVSWDDAVAYCAALTQRERAAGRITTNAVYRLPTEAEWEYACRAWTSTRFSYGDDLGYTNLTNYAWYSDNSGGTTHPVGQKLPNPWGLYDLHGNVWEWCQDWFDTYPGGIALDPQGPATGSTRVVRGGNWLYWNGRARDCRSAYRDYSGYGSGLIGFRVVLAPGQP